MRIFCSFFFGILCCTSLLHASDLYGPGEISSSDETSTVNGADANNTGAPDDLNTGNPAADGTDNTGESENEQVDFEPVTPDGLYTPPSEDEG